MSQALCGLERMGVVLQLAASLWYCRALRYGLETVHWDALDPLVKHAYVDRAEDILEQLKPAAAGPDELFAQAAEMARSEGRRLRLVTTSDGRES